MPAFLWADKYVIMNNTQVRQTLNALADALESANANAQLNPDAIAASLPKRSLSGDHINGGKIVRFSSTGISDQATKEQIVITDDAVTIKNLKIESINNDLTVAGTLKVDVLEVAELKANVQYEKDTSITFGGDNVYGKGLLWTGTGYTKQLVFNSNPDRIFSSESIDLAKGKALSINKVTVVDEHELGPTVTKSHLREVGRLRGLVVDGGFSVNQYFFYNPNSDRLGLGTEEPNAAISIVEQDVEVMLGGRDSVRGIVGTFAGHDLDIVTDNTSRINVSAGGNITLGNSKTSPVQVSVHGKLAIKVNSPDPEVDLHVNGAIKYNGRLQKYDKTFPDSGFHNPGDIVWNIEPRLNAYVGWICTQAGNPGMWAPFGKIGNQ